MSEEFEKNFPSFVFLYEEDISETREHLKPKFSEFRVMMNCLDKAKVKEIIGDFWEKEFTEECESDYQLYKKLLKELGL